MQNAKYNMESNKYNIESNNNNNITIQGKNQQQARTVEIQDEVRNTIK